ncbi:MAG: amino acid permease [Balneolales bacterium]|nr:amino acid permease [Balneolales bacterium]
MADKQHTDSRRTLGLFSATGIGVGAMVGGGILALAGVAFEVSGPSAMLAFVLNGIIALVTALSFAEMAAANPQSGGTYTYAKKTSTVHVAFGVGWVVWFASLVAAVLYALGFGSFFTFSLQQIIPLISGENGNSTFFTNFLNTRTAPVVLGLIALSVYTAMLTRPGGGSGSVANIVKISVFAVLIAGGLVVSVQKPATELISSLQPFFSGGMSGVIAAMGFTFIAMQGFDLIGSAAGEIKEPSKNIPKAMIGTIFIGLLIYLPLLFVVITVGTPAGDTIQNMSAASPETVIAIAAENYLGPFGFWLVLVAGIFSMLSALQANLFAASRIVFSMANDRTLSRELAVLDARTGIPVRAVLITGGIVAVLILVIPDVAAAGAASSLIFLLTFAIAHIIMMLMRQRGFKDKTTFKVPFYPYLPIGGMIACLALAIFQAVVVPAAGIIAGIWLLCGFGLFLFFFVKSAKVADASDEALNPEISRLRGLSPLVLLPIANPDSAPSMVFVAQALAPPVVGRVLLLTIITPSADNESRVKKLQSNQQVLYNALDSSYNSGLQPDALTTIANEPWEEILRVSKTHNCRSILMGLSSLSEKGTNQNLENLISRLECDLVVFRQRETGWNISTARRILIPVGGSADHDILRARIVSSLWRSFQPEFTFLHLLPANTSQQAYANALKKLDGFSRRLIPGNPENLVVLTDDVRGELVRQSSDFDLVIMGLGKAGNNRTVFGEIPIAIARETNTSLIFISNK